MTSTEFLAMAISAQRLVRDLRRRVLSGRWDAAARASRELASLSAALDAASSALGGDLAARDSHPNNSTRSPHQRPATTTKESTHDV